MLEGQKLNPFETIEVELISYGNPVTNICDGTSHKKCYQIKLVNNLPSRICATQSLANLMVNYITLNQITMCKHPCLGSSYP